MKNKKVKTPAPQLPLEVWNHVLSFLNNKDLRIASDVCHDWKVFARETFLKRIQREDFLKTIQIVCGDDFTIFSTSNGNLYSCGNNDYGQLGLGNRTPSSTLKLIPFFEKKELKVLQLATGANHTIVRTHNNIYAWGKNYSGQLGIDSRCGQHPPQILSFFKEKGLHVAQLVAGENYTVAVTSKGHLYAWGDTNSDRFERDNISYHPIPRELPVFKTRGFKVKQLAISEGHVIVLTSDNSLYAWGDNTYGQLGLDNDDKQTTPQIIMFFKEKELTVKQLVAGENHTAVLTTKGNIYIWGNKEFGQLGSDDDDDDFDIREAPRKLPFFKNNVVQLITVANHNFAITDDGSVYGWGKNNKGQLGLGHTKNQMTPQKLSFFEKNGLKISTLAASKHHTIAATPTGRVYSWGKNNKGQLGLGAKSMGIVSAPCEIKGFNLFTGLKTTPSKQSQRSFTKKTLG